MRGRSGAAATSQPRCMLLAKQSSPLDRGAPAERERSAARRYRAVLRHIHARREARGRRGAPRQLRAARTQRCCWSTLLAIKRSRRRQAGQAACPAVVCRSVLAATAAPKSIFGQRRSTSQQRSPRRQRTTLAPTSASPAVVFHGRETSDRAVNTFLGGCELPVRAS